jgi:hypothetical protein
MSTNKLSISFSDSVLGHTTHEDIHIGTDVIGDPNDDHLGDMSNHNISPHINNNTLISTEDNTKLNLNPNTNLRNPPMTNHPMTTVRLMPWLKTPMMNGKSRSRPRPKRNQLVVINPIFEQFIETLKDPFWVNVMKECSYGKFPRGTSFRNNILSSRKGLKVISEELNNDLIDGPQKCIEFFQTHCNLKSDHDLILERERLDVCGINGPKISTMSWSDIRSGSVKQSIILDYIYKIHSERNLNREQLNNLKTQVNLGFTLKYFTSDHVVFSNGVISDIKGLKWDHHKEEFYIDRSITNTPKFAKLKDFLSEEVYKDPEHKITPKSTYVDYAKKWSKTSEQINKKA